MIGTLPSWVRQPILNWISVARNNLNVLDEKSNWERLFESSRQNKLELKELGRAGVPSDLRSKVWCSLLRVDLVPSHLKSYQDCLWEYFGAETPEHFPVIPLADSFDRFLPTNNSMHNYQEDIKGILYIIGSSSPDQKINRFMISLVAILRSQMGPNEVLGCMASILKIHPNHRTEWAYIPSDERNHALFSKVFGRLILEFEPSIAWKLNQLELVDCLPWNDLLASFFIKIYPRKVILRIVDCFLIEGFKIVYRMGLAHLHKRRTQILKARNKEELWQAIFLPELCSSKEIISTLFSIAFKYSLSRTKIKRIRKSILKREKCISLTSSASEFLVVPRPTPKLNEPSHFMDTFDLVQLWQWIPKRLVELDLKMVFTTRQHGYSLSSLYHYCSWLEPLLLILETEDGDILGAFISKSFEYRGVHYFGTGETFIFSLTSTPPKKYSWDPSKNDMALIYATDDYLAFGAGFAIRIDSDLSKVSSYASVTFDSQSLIPAGASKIINLEVYSFV